jgi:hypothetical protein
VSTEAWLRLALVPAAVWLASLAARRWGHAVSGYLGGMPLIGGPITLFLALDLGDEFAARSALYTLAGVLGQAAHLLAFAHLGQRNRWPLALAAAWTSFFAVSWAITQWPLTPFAALALAGMGLAAAWHWLPRPRGEAVKPQVPAFELYLRLAAAFVLAAVIVWAARFGPAVSGILLSLPITGTIMPAFTLALYGPAPLARLIRGFVAGLCGFSAFFFVVAVATASWGAAWAFPAALAAALAAVFASTRLMGRTSGSPRHP